MRIRVWNAFASNNSGSYTIVGCFATAGRAEECARELAAMVAAHHAWYTQSAEVPSEESPIVAFAKAKGLQWSAGLGQNDEWPDEYARPPRVIAVDRQVIVHAPFTVTMPHTFGELFYAYGGTVDVTLDHAHDALVVHVELYWPWQLPENERKARAAAAEAVVTAVDSPLRPLVEGGQLACARGRDWHDVPLVIGAVFQDLVTGVAAAAALAKAHGAEHHVKIFEALDPGDPLSHLRGKR